MNKLLYALAAAGVVAIVYVAKRMVDFHESEKEAEQASKAKT